MSSVGPGSEIKKTEIKNTENESSALKVTDRPQA